MLATLLESSGLPLLCVREGELLAVVWVAAEEIGLGGSGGGNGESAVYETVDARCTGGGGLAAGSWNLTTGSGVVGVRRAIGLPWTRKMEGEGGPAAAETEETGLGGGGGNGESELYDLVDDRFTGEVNVERSR